MTQKEKTIQILNELLSCLEPIKYKQFNKVLKAKDKKKLEELSNKYPEISIANRKNKNYGMTTLTIINTIINNLVNDKIYINLDSKGNVEKFGWMSEHMERMKKIIEMTDKIYASFPDHKIKFKTDGTYVNEQKIPDDTEYTLQEMLKNATPEMSKNGVLDAADIWYLEKMASIKKYLESKY